MTRIASHADRYGRNRICACIVNRVTHNSADGLVMTREDPEKVAGQHLKLLRRAHGWSQREVAERMRPHGYTWHQTVVAKIETGTRPLRLNEALDLAALFGVSLATLLAPPRGPESFETVRHEIAALEAGLAQAEERAARSGSEAAEKAQEHAVTLAEIESIKSRLQLLATWQEEAATDGA